MKKNNRGKVIFPVSIWKHCEAERTCFITLSHQIISLQWFVGQSVDRLASFLFFHITMYLLCWRTHLFARPILSPLLLRPHTAMNIKRTARLLSDFKSSSFFPPFLLIPGNTCARTFLSDYFASCNQEPQHHLGDEPWQNAAPRRQGSALSAPWWMEWKKRVLSCFSDSYQRRSIRNSTPINTELHFSTLSDPATLSVMTRKALHSTTLASVAPSSFCRPVNVFDAVSTGVQWHVITSWHFYLFI